MANELGIENPSAEARFAVLLNAAGQIYDKTATAFVNSPNATYSRHTFVLAAVTNQPGIYAASMPAGIPSGTYTYSVYAGDGSAAPLASAFRGTGRITWDGTAEVIGGSGGGGGASASDIATAVDTALADNFAAVATATTTIAAAVNTVAGYTDTLEGSVATIGSATSTIQSAVGTINANTDTVETTLASFVVTLNRILGLSGRNRVVRDFVRNGQSQVTQFTVRTYDTAAHAATDDGSTGLLESVTMDATYSGGVLAKETHKVAA